MQEIVLMNVKPDIRKILLIGAEGTAKTHFIGTMPKPIYVFSFDDGYQTLAGHDRIKVGYFDMKSKDRKNPQVYKEFMQKFGMLESGSEKWEGKEGYKTVALDPITFLSRFLFDDIQRMNNNVDKPAGYEGWGLVKSRTTDLLDRIAVMSNYVVCTSLIESERDDLTGELFYKPTMEGKIRDTIGAWFDAVFYMNVDKALDGKVKWEMLLVGSKRHKAKIRIPASLRGSLSASEEPDYGKLMEKIGKGGEKVS